MTISELHQLFLASQGISTDTRKLDKNTLFFALKGAHFNGNQFALKALEEGCHYAVVDEDIKTDDERVIRVDSVLKTLQDLANFHRQQFDIPVIGITGSNGKTTTKELVGEVLKTTYHTLVTEGNLNNHLGVPFTLLRLTKEHQMAVIEMGANKPGDIQELVEIAEPTHGLITNIGTAHIEGFGSYEGVLKTKTEMYRFLGQNHGTIFVNASDKTLLNQLPNVKAFTYHASNAFINGKLVSSNPFICLKWSKSDYESPLIETHLVGTYNFINFLAAIAIGSYFDVKPERINDALAHYQPTNKRSQVQKTSKNTLIVDCYNANPTSMQAAIETIDQMESKHKLLILGDMLELGDLTESEHTKIIDILTNKGLKAILIGSRFKALNSPFPSFDSVDDEALKNQLKSVENHLILLKGSRGIQLEKLIDIL